MNQRFHKSERICSRKQIEYLFKKGKHRSVAPIRLTLLTTETEQHSPSKAMFIVPKRLFKKAVQRNKLKRRMKEAYRKNKNTLYENLNLSGKKVLLGFSYNAKEMHTYAEIEEAICKLIEKIK